MISKKAKERAKQIDEKNRSEYKKKEKKRKEYREEARFMEDYGICPRCGGEAKYLFWKSIWSSENKYWKCKKCNLQRKYRFLLDWW